MDYPNFELTGLVKYDQIARCFCSYCPELDLYSAGDSENEAAEALLEAVMLFIKHCSQDEILDEALQKRGLTVNNANQVARLDDPSPALHHHWTINENGASRAALSALHTA